MFNRFIMLFKEVGKSVLIVHDLPGIKSFLLILNFLLGLPIWL
ncbi:hypothetical protein [Bacillus cereus group sp. RP32]